MDKLRDDTLVEILKKEKAYPHEIRSIIPELQLLRDIFNGKQPKDAYKPDTMTVTMPMTKIVEDNVDVLVGDIWATQVGQTVLARHSISAGSAHNTKRYLIHRVK